MLLLRMMIPTSRYRTELKNREKPMTIKEKYGKSN